MDENSLKSVLTGYTKSEKALSDLINCVNSLKAEFIKSGCDDEAVSVFDDINAEIIGLTTESNSYKSKLMESSTKRAITEYLLSYLKNIENDIINSSKTRMRIQQKIKKLISDYLRTNYFKKILVVTVLDGLVDSIYGDEYTLSRYLLDMIKLKNISQAQMDNFLDVYKDVLDSCNITDLKIAFRKTVIEEKPDDDIFSDLWTELSKILSREMLFTLFNSLSFYKTMKDEFCAKYISPLLESLNSDEEKSVFDEYTKVNFEDKDYYVSSISTFEDNDTKFERFITKLKAYNHKNEAELLHIYISNDPDLLTDQVINEKFSALPEIFLNELLKINTNKYKKTCIGHVILSEPTIKVEDDKTGINFIVRMLFDSIYKMSEILLINDYEFHEFQKELLITLQQISQLRDIETANHQERVTIYTKILAESIMSKKDDKTLNKLLKENNMPLDSDYFIVDNEYIRDLMYSASLHDLGKVGIDDSILKNPNKLTEAEYEKMQKHTIFGHERLASIIKISRKKSFLILAAGLAENHHEKWDGTGYPNGKKGLEIPLSARILMIADVYDALRIKRSYKKAFTHSEVVEHISERKGIFFDPVITDIFIENNEKFNEAFKSNK